MDEGMSKWSKMTIAQLKETFGHIVPKRLKKKSDILEFLSQSQEVSVSASEPVVDADAPAPAVLEEIKRPKMNPVFAKSITSKPQGSDTISTQNLECCLCEGRNTVWCEVGIALCPLCVPADPQPRSPPCTPPQVKQERGVTTVPYKFDADGNAVLQTQGIDLDRLTALVTQYGFGLCESIEAIQVNPDSLEAAVEALIRRARSSAENSSIAEAQLNSEQIREETKEKVKASRKNAREAVLEDLTVLLEVDSEFCTRFLFCEHPVAVADIATWIQLSPQHVLVVFDYLVVKRDSIRWYKQCAADYFGDVESAELANVEVARLNEWFKVTTQTVSEGLFSLPATGGSIPTIFRTKQSGDVMPSESDDIEVVSAKGGDECLKSDLDRLVVQLE